MHVLVALMFFFTVKFSVLELRWALSHHTDDNNHSHRSAEVWQRMLQYGPLRAHDETWCFDFAISEVK